MILTERRFIEVPIHPRRALKELELNYLSLGKRLNELKMKEGYDMTDQRDSAWDKLQTIVCSGAVWIHLKLDLIEKNF